MDACSARCRGMGTKGSHPWGRWRGRTDIFVRQLVVETHALGLVLHRLAVDDGALELLENGSVDGVTLRSCKRGPEEVRVMPRWDPRGGGPV